MNEGAISPKDMVEALENNVEGWHSLPSEEQYGAILVACEMLVEEEEVSHERF